MTLKAEGTHGSLLPFRRATEHAPHLVIIIFFLALTAFSPRSVFSTGFTSAAIGTTSGDFLQMGVGARAAGMGEAFCSVADDASAMYWNPAALTRIPDRSVTLMHAAYIASSYFDYGAFGQKIGPYGAWGAAAQFLSAGSIPETDQTASDIGTFSPNDLAVSLGYGYQLHDLEFLSDLNGASFGISAKYIQSTIVSTARTGATDIGFLTRTYWDDRLRFAFTMTNVGGKLKYEQQAESLPFAYRLGSSIKILNHWTGALDFGFPKGNSPFAAIGTEYSWPVSDAVQLAGRIGYNSRTTADITGFTGASLGLGLGLRTFSFDYAFVPMGGLGQTHRISLNFNF